MQDSTKILSTTKGNNALPTVENSVQLPPDVLNIVASFLLPKDFYSFGVTNKKNFQNFCYLVTGNSNFDTLMAFRKIQLGKEFKNFSLNLIKATFDSTAKEEWVMQQLCIESSNFENLKPEDKFLRYPEAFLQYIKYNPNGMKFLESEQLDSPVMIEKLSTGELTLKEARIQRDSILSSMDFLENMMLPRVIQGHIIDQSMTISDYHLLEEDLRDFLTGNWRPFSKLHFPSTNQEIFAVMQQCFKRHPYFLKKLCSDILMASVIPTLFIPLLRHFMKVMNCAWIRNAISKGELHPEKSFYCIRIPHDENKVFYVFEQKIIQKAVDKKVFSIDQVMAFTEEKIHMLIMFNDLRDVVFNDDESKKLFIALSCDCAIKMTTKDGLNWFRKVFNSKQLTAKAFLKLPEDRKKCLLLTEIQQAFSAGSITEKHFIELDDDNFVQLVQDAIRQQKWRAAPSKDVISWLGR